MNTGDVQGRDDIDQALIIFNRNHTTSDKNVIRMGNRELSSATQLNREWLKRDGPDPFS